MTKESMSTNLQQKQKELPTWEIKKKTLYNIIKTLSRRKTGMDKPVKDKGGQVLTKLKEQREKWNEHFISVLDRPEPD